MWWAKQYKKVTSASELVDGAKYLIVSVETSSKYYTIGAVNSNNRTAVEVSVSGDIATATIATASGSSNAHEVMLIASSTNWNLYDVANAMFLNGGCKKSSGSGNNNNLKTQSSVETTADKGKYNGVWSIEVNTTSGVATITNQNSYTIKYNPNTSGDYPLIASYSSGQTDVCLYKEIAEPVAPITSSTWDFSSSVTQKAALNGAVFTASAENTLYDTNLFSTIIYSAGSGDELNANGYLKSNGTSGPSAKRYFILEIENSGTLEMFSKSTFGTYSIRKAATASTSWSSATEIATITTATEGTGVSADITYDADKPYLFIGLTAKAYTQKMKWTPTTDKITLTTSANMDGWRAFYDATQDYTLDANTKAYVAQAKSGTSGVVELTQLNATAIPHGEAVILKTSAGDHKMVLTKTTGASTLGDNLLAVTDGSSNVDGYRLGYGNIGGDNKVGFFKYTTTTAPAAGIVYIAASNVNNGAGARGLAIDFNDDVTAIEAVKAQNVVKGEYFNLAGQRVAQPTKGLYIVNGKKVVIK